MPQQQQLHQPIQPQPLQQPLQPHQPHPPHPPQQQQLHQPIQPQPLQQPHPPHQPQMHQPTQPQPLQQPLQPHPPHQPQMHQPIQPQPQQQPLPPPHQPQQHQPPQQQQHQPLPPPPHQPQQHHPPQPQQQQQSLPPHQPQQHQPPQPQHQPQQPQQHQPLPPDAIKRRLVDRVCPPKTNEIAPEIKSYQDMLDFERKLDFNISRKTLDIQESLKRPARVKKTLKVSITNLFYRQQDTGAPAWEVRIEGGLTDDKMPKRKFSSFFKSLVIELDSTIYGPDNHLVEWHRTATTSETDGFQVRRAGDLPVKCTILLQLNNSPPHFKIDERLARLVGKKADTRQAVIFALWQYIKNGALQDPQDREYINNDEYLKSIFECKRMKFSEIPAKLDKLLTAPDPIVINHSIVRGNGESQRATFHFEVEIENTLDTRILNHDSNEIRQLDETVFGLVADIKRSITNYEFFSDFSRDPQQSINKWLAAQSSDLKIMTDQVGDAEEERKADYYYQPWMQEAVCRYFYRKVQERRNELEMALTSMRR